MRLLILDTESSGLDLAIRAQQAGHTVKWWDQKRKDGTTRRAGEGIIEKIDDYDMLRTRWLHWADLIWLTDNTTYMEMLEPFRLQGFPIFGGGIESATWEMDRAVGQRVMKAAGLNIIPGREFNDYDAAIAYVKKEGKPFVSKPNGRADKAMSYVATNAADLVYMLGRWKKNDKYRSDAREFGFILQEKKTGIEFSASGWFGPHGWSRIWEEAVEFKKLMVGDCGPNTGEMGTLLWFTEESKLAEMVLRPLTAQLRAIGYVGCINVNCIIDDEGAPWPLEFTMREGWPAKHNEIALQEGDPVQWMADLCDGQDTMQARTDLVSVSVVLVVPEFPYSHLTNKEVEGFPIYGAGDMEHVHLCEVMLGESPVQSGDKVVDIPCFQTAGDYVAVVTGTGETISGARRSAYAAVKKVRVVGNMMHRTDIGAGRFVKQLPELQSHGYAKKISY